MLKKAGIVVVAATAGLLALSPLAFASDKDHHGDTKNHDDKGYSQVEEGGDSTDVELTNVETDNQTNDCEFGQAGPDVDSSATGGSSLLGLGGLVANAIAPVTTQTQLLNCNNVDVSDVADLNSNNTDETTTSTEVEDSFNR